MAAATLQQLVRRYSGAPYSFFRLTNYRLAEKEFLGKPSMPPTFTYGKYLQADYLQRRKQELEKILAEADVAVDEPLHHFVTRRLKETELLLASVALRTEPANSLYLRTFRSLVEELYGSFDRRVFAGLLHYLSERAQVTGTQETFKGLVHLLNRAEIAPNLVWPTQGVFQHYRRLMLESAHPVAELAKHTTRTAALADNALDLFRWAAAANGAEQEGWVVKRQPGQTHVHVSRHTKKIIVGGHFQPRSELRLAQVVAHEVFVHVERTLRCPEHTVAVPEEEGLAIMVEQLLSDRFVPKRSLRYLAAAAAWGVDGRPRNFVETFEIVWRAFRIVGGHNEAAAKQGAFKECVRVFRGGAPETAGAAFIKDKIYLESNLKVWQYLQQELLDEAAFFAYIHGEG